MTEEKPKQHDVDYQDYEEETKATKVWYTYQIRL